MSLPDWRMCSRRRTRTYALDTCLHVHTQTHRSLGMQQFINIRSINNHKWDVKAVYKTRQANIYVHVGLLDCTPTTPPPSQSLPLVHHPNLCTDKLNCFHVESRFHCVIDSLVSATVFCFLSVSFLVVNLGHDHSKLTQKNCWFKDVNCENNNLRFLITNTVITIACLRLIFLF